MKRRLFIRTLLISMLTSALLSFTACKSDEDKADEDKCKEGDLVACVKAAVKDVDKRAASATNGINESKDVGNENSSAGSLVDKRDGKKYKIVKIGNQTWMAENLKVKTEGSWCYEDKESNCQKYGRLYNWNAAKTACPAGWHLPSKEEFEILLKSVGGVQDKEDAWEWKDAGKKLKSTSDWKEYEGKNGNGNDAFGFSALPAGPDYSEDFNELGYFAYFWSSTENDSDYALTMNLYSYSDNAYLIYFGKIDGFSIRCLKDY